MKTVSLDTSGRFETAKRLTAGEILTTQAFDRSRMGAMAYVKTDSKSPTLDKFFIDTIAATKVFDAVLDSEGLQTQVIARARALGSTAAFVDNKVGLYELSRTIGPFLVIEPVVEWRGGYDYEAALKVTDAATAETIFLARSKAFNWAGLDEPLFYPLFNAFIDWTKGVAPPPPRAPSPARQP